MDSATRTKAVAEIKRLFAGYRASQTTDRNVLKALQSGKLYELFVLAEMLRILSGRGFICSFQGVGKSTLKFKASPGQIKLSDSHFEVQPTRSPGSVFRMFVDIEFQTLGCEKIGARDNSRHHELDIVLTTATRGYPKHDEILLGVECKAVANFTKGILKEALGVRRELSLLDSEQPSTLSLASSSSPRMVPANPASEFYLTFIDPKGGSYSQSPSAFGIEFSNLQP